MYQVSTSVHIHFAHHVRGHGGPCISLHGHTWQFEITFGSQTLDRFGFVVDFDEVQAQVLTPCHELLDHSLALGEKSFREVEQPLSQMGRAFLGSREETLGHTGSRQAGLDGQLVGAKNEWPSGIKIAVFPFSPTSERLAEWFYNLGQERLSNQRVQVLKARVYETLAPVPCYADYTGPSEASGSTSRG